MRSAHLVLPMLLLAITLSGTTSARAQSAGAVWSDPVVLTPNDNVVAFSPAAVADTAGHLHAVWTEGDDSSGQAVFDTIYYASSDSRTWTTPIDIAVSATGMGMSFVKGFIATNTGMLAVTWSEGQDIRLAVASSVGAASAQAWRTSRVASGVNPSLAATAAGDHWYLAYWSDTSTLVITESKDEGVTWGTPQLIWSANDDSAGSNVSTLVARYGSLHLVWTETALTRAWNGVAIWYAQWDPGTARATVRQVSRSASPDEPTLDGANLVECPNGQLHIVWNNGIGSSTGRFHQWWNPDSGRWSQVAAIFPGLSGQTSRPGLVCDSTGRVHLLTAAPSSVASDPSSGLRYATWYDGAWSEYVTLWGGAHQGERPSMVILGGDELHLVWQVFDLSGEEVSVTGHAYRAIDAEAEASVAIDRPAPTATRSPLPTQTRQSVAAGSEISSAPTALATPAYAVSGTVSPLVIAVAAVVLILGAAMWLARRRRR